MRKYFSKLLHRAMLEDNNIYLITADLGYGLFEDIQKDFPDRYINPGAAEQLAMGIATGLALEGKRPYIYSITPFLILRPFEIIRTYIDYENIPVQLIGAGAYKDYTHDGISHWADDIVALSSLLKSFSGLNIPDSKEELDKYFSRSLVTHAPMITLLRR